MLKLRGHHLICLNFFRGHGYDKKFVENLQNILKNIEELEVVEGLDDVCRACPHNAGFCNYSRDSEKEVKALDDFALELLKVKIGMRLKWNDLRMKITGVMEKWRKIACMKCDWKGVCDA
ncbi:MAG: DUF1284 domain-containing protein [Archaeoglobaceae archaeon]|nr:DUF1284 domain-containing protein [Archaeoglobaceae archaeon]MDW7989573.1 DUF1284 domain-containing protein [Archaeoglobaceae archaeon]